MSLFKECLEALQNKATLLSDRESAKIEVVLQNLFPFTSANINWDKVEKKIAVDSVNPVIISNLKKALKTPLDENIYLVWDAQVPVLKTDLYTAIANFDDVTSVSVRTWFLNLHQGYVLEWHWCGTKVIGLASEKKIHQANLLKKSLNELPNLKFISYDMYGKPREIRRLLSRFAQPKYWNISPNYCVISSTGIIPCIEEILKKTVTGNVFLLWSDKSLPMLQSDIKSVIANWNGICEVQPQFQILDNHADFLINFSLEQGITIRFNFGLNVIK